MTGAFKQYQTAGTITPAEFEQEVARLWRGADLRTMLAASAEHGVADPMTLRAIRGLAVLTIGAISEAGEAADHFKKHLRGDKIDRRAALLEIGDALYYLTALTQVLGYNLTDAMQANVDKLNERAESTSATARYTYVTPGDEA